MFNIKVNPLTILGTIIVSAGLLFLIWSLIDSFLPKNIAPQGITYEQYKDISEAKTKYEDSFYTSKFTQLQDSINFAIERSNKSDSALNYFYNITNKYYDEKIDEAYNASADDIIRQWEVRYSTKN